MIKSIGLSIALISLMVMQKYWNIMQKDFVFSLPADDYYRNNNWQVQSGICWNLTLTPEVPAHHSINVAFSLLCLLLLFIIDSVGCNFKMHMENASLFFFFYSLDVFNTFVYHYEMFMLILSCHCTLLNLEKLKTNNIKTIVPQGGISWFICKTELGFCNS